MVTRHLNESAQRFSFDPRKVVPFSSLESVVPVAIFFIFGFFNALTEGGWAGLGLTIGITALFIATYAARPPHL